MRYTTVKALANDWLTEMEYHGSIKPEIIYRLCNNAAEILIGSEWLSYKIAILSVDNFTAAIPPNFHSETLVACVKNHKQFVNRGVIKSFTQDAFGTDCEIEVNLLCPSCHKETCSCSSPVLTIDIDQVYLDTHPYMKQISYQNMIGWAAPNDDGFNQTHPFTGFHPMKPRTSAEILWNMEYYLGVCESENLHYDYTYQIDGDKFITDLKEGQVVMAYLAYHKDADGYLMIPNVIWAVDAVKDYITTQWMWREWMMNGNQNNRLRWLDAKNMSTQKLHEAKSKLEIPTATKWYDTMSTRFVIPRDDYYY